MAVSNIDTMYRFFNATRQAAFPLVAVLVLLPVLSGCGGAGSEQPELGLVTGTVTYDDLPLGGVQVTFYPDDGRPAMARTGPDGKYDLIYIRDTHGCKVGHCRVEIGFDEEEDEGIEFEGDDAVQAPGVNKERIRISSRYNTESELEATVKPGENVFDFHLKPPKPDSDTP